MHLHAFLLPVSWTQLPRNRGLDAVVVAAIGLLVGIWVLLPARRSPAFIGQILVALGVCVGHVSSMVAKAEHGG